MIHALRTAVEWLIQHVLCPLYPNGYREIVVHFGPRTYLWCLRCDRMRCIAEGVTRTPRRRVKRRAA